MLNKATELQCISWWVKGEAHFLSSGKTSDKNQSQAGT